MGMITYIITGDNIAVDEVIRAHVESHFSKFEKFVDDGAVHEMIMTLSKTTQHQRQDSYRVEVKFKISSENYFVASDNQDVISAIDEAKDSLMREITKKHGKDRRLFTRGARKIKSMAKGFSGFGKKK